MLKRKVSEKEFAEMLNTMERSGLGRHLHIYELCFDKQNDCGNMQNVIRIKCVAESPNDALMLGVMRMRSWNFSPDRIWIECEFSKEENNG